MRMFRNMLLEGQEEYLRRSSYLYRIGKVKELVPAGSDILEVGCGIGLLACILSEKASSLTGIDISAERVNGAAGLARKAGVRNAKFRVGDACGPAIAGRFDVAISLEVFEHLPDPKRAVANVRGALKEGGMFIVSVPNGYSPATFLFDRARNIGHVRTALGLGAGGGKEHIQEYGLNSFRGLLEKGGFAVERVLCMGAGLGYLINLLKKIGGADIGERGLLLGLRRLDDSLGNISPYLAASWVFVCRRL